MKSVQKPWKCGARGENIMEGFAKVMSPKWRLDGCKLAKGSRAGLETEAIAHMKAQRCELQCTEHILCVID